MPIAMAHSTDQAGHLSATTRYGADGSQQVETAVAATNDAAATPAPIPADIVTDVAAPVPSPAAGNAAAAPATAIEQIALPAGALAPAHAIKASNANDTLAGTAAADLFFFDTATGVAGGNDQIVKFGAGDRLVTTSALADANSAGRIKANSSDRFALPGTPDGAGDSTGSLKIYATSGKAMSAIKLVGTEQHGGATFYIYAATGDANAGATLDFGDTVSPGVTITGSTASLAAGQTAMLTLTFSEPPVGFTKADIVVESGTLTALTATADPKIFTVDYAPAANVHDDAVQIDVAAQGYADAAGNAGLAAHFELAVDTVPHGARASTGTAAADSLVATTADAWTIAGLGGNDHLIGNGGRDLISGGAGDDRLAGGGGDDQLDGGSGIDTALFSGSRGDYSFHFADGLLTAQDLRAGAPDCTDTLVSIEQFAFASGSNRPVGAIEGSPANDTLVATAAVDTFLFDTATGLSGGNDQIRNWGAGDRFVTTSALFDDNADGRIKANASDRFVLPDTLDGGTGESTGTLKLLNAAGKPVTNIVLEGVTVDHGLTYYVYGASGDAAVDAALHW